LNWRDVVAIPDLPQIRRRQGTGVRRDAALDVHRLKHLLPGFDGNRVRSIHSPFPRVRIANDPRNTLLETDHHTYCPSLLIIQKIANLQKAFQYGELLPLSQFDRPYSDTPGASRQKHFSRQVSVQVIWVSEPHRTPLHP